MCINIGVLFGIIRVVRVWCGIMIVAVGITNKVARYDSSMPGFQNQTVLTDWCPRYVS